MLSIALASTIALVGCGDLGHEDDSAQEAADKLSLVQAGDEEWVVACAHLSVLATWEGCRKPEKSNRCVYNPPPGWAIVEHQVEELSGNNGWSSVNTIAGGSEFISETDLVAAYDQAIELAVRSGKRDVEARIRQRYDQHLSDYRRYRATNNTLEAIVTAKPHGWCPFDKKRGWMSIRVKARLRYLGTGSKSELIQALKREFAL